MRPRQRLLLGAALLAGLASCKTMNDMAEAVKATLEPLDKAMQTSLAEADKDIQDELDFLENRIGPFDAYVYGQNWTAAALGKASLHKPEHPFHDYLQKVGTTVALASHAPYQYQGYVFGVLDDGTRNAAAYPSGFILITRGLLRAVHSEDELAAALAHEIAHQEIRHNMLSVAQGKSLMVMEWLTRQAVKASLQGGSAEGARQSAGTMFSLMEAMTLGYNKRHELEADRRAAELLAIAGYDPHAMLAVLERLEDRDGALGGRGYPRGRARLLREHLRRAGLSRPVPVPEIRDRRFRAAIKGFIEPVSEASRPRPAPTSLAEASASRTRH